MAKQTLLVVDGDGDALRVMEVSLRNAGYAVTTAEDGQVAAEALKTLRPALVLSDTELPKLSGLELLMQVRSHDDLAQIPFLFLTNDISIDTRLAALEQGADDFLTRPIYIQEIVTRVRMALLRHERRVLVKSNQRRFFGDLNDMGVVDLLQMVELGQKRGELSIEGGGHIFFEQGRVIDATVNHLYGKDALYRLLTWKAGNFEFDFDAPERPAQMDLKIQTILLEGLKHVAQWRQTTEQLPDLGRALSVDQAEAEECADELSKQDHALLRLFDGSRTIQAAIDDSGLADLDAAGAISRLYFEGVLRDEGGLVAIPEAIPPTSPPQAMPEALVEALTERVDELSIKPVEVIAPKAPKIEAKPDGVLDLPRSAPRQPESEPEAATRADSTPKEPPLEIKIERHPIPETENEAAFFSQVEPEYPVEEPFTFSNETTSEPASKSALGVLAVLVLCGLGAATYFLGMDQVKPVNEAKGAIDSSWHRVLLRARPKLAAATPIKGDWRLPGSEIALDTVPVDTTPATAPKKEAVPTEDAVPAPAKEAPPTEAPAGLTALLEAGLALHQAEDYAGAIDKFNAAVKLAPTSQDALMGLARSKYESGKDADALKTAHKVIQLNPKNARAHLMIGTILQGMGKKEAAIEAYEHFLKLAPKGQFSKEVTSILRDLK